MSKVMKFSYFRWKTGAILEKADFILGALNPKCRAVARE